jgi:hypothetical protein
MNPITGHYESDLPMKKCRRWFTVLSVNHRREDRNLCAKDYSNFNAALSGFSEIVNMDFFFMILTVLAGAPIKIPIRIFAKMFDFKGNSTL